jgi:hypothetical protein
MRGSGTGTATAPANCSSSFTASDSRWLCELRDDGEEYGVMAQFYQNEELVTGRRFDRRMDPARTPREMAIQWAEEERKRIEAAP